MSRVRTLQQERANRAWECIQELWKETYGGDGPSKLQEFRSRARQGEADSQPSEQIPDSEKPLARYRSLVRSTPALVQNAGLLQTLAFFESKGETDGSSRGNDNGGESKKHFVWLSEHLKKCVCEPLQDVLGLSEQDWQPQDKKLLDLLMDCSPLQLRMATAEARAHLVWLKLLAEANLPKSAESLDTTDQ